MLRTHATKIALLTLLVSAPADLKVGTTGLDTDLKVGTTGLAAGLIAR